MAVDDEGSNVVERNTAHLRTFPADGHETPFGGEVRAIGCDLYNATNHVGGPGSKSLPDTVTRTLRAHKAFKLPGDLVR